MTLALTGATGFVGQALMERAAEAGVAVRALTRRAQTERAGVTWVSGDLHASNALSALASGAEAVIHVAGVVNAADADGFQHGNVDGTLRAIEAALKAGVKRFICVSSLSAREPQLSAYGASKARAEKLVRASGLDWTIVRPPAIYGPRDQELLALFKAVKWGLVPMPQRQGRASYIHVDDLARLLLALVPGGEGISAQTFEPDDGEPGGWAHNEFARTLGHAVGRRPLVLHLSPNLLAFAGRASRWLLGDKAKLTPDRASYMSHPDWVSSPAAQVPKALWQPQISLADGLADTAAWYRENSYL